MFWVMLSKMDWIYHLTGCCSKFNTHCSSLLCNSLLISLYHFSLSSSFISFLSSCRHVASIAWQIKNSSLMILILTIGFNTSITHKGVPSFQIITTNNMIENETFLPIQKKEHKPNSVMYGFPLQFYDGHLSHSQIAMLYRNQRNWNIHNRWKCTGRETKTALYQKWKINEYIQLDFIYVVILTKLETQTIF